MLRVGFNTKKYLKLWNFPLIFYPFTVTDLTDFLPEENFAGKLECGSAQLNF